MTNSICAAFWTIAAVELFVDRQYAAQIGRLRQRPDQRALCCLLEACRSDELAHRDDARTRAGPPGVTGRIWAAVVDLGSRAGVYLAGQISRSTLCEGRSIRLNALELTERWS